MLKVSAADGPATGNIIEAAIDDVLFWVPFCEIHNPPPNPVDDLSIEHDGVDVSLRWGRPALDPAHGEPDRYRVYRSDDNGHTWTHDPKPVGIGWGEFNMTLLRSGRLMAFIRVQRMLQPEDPPDQLA